MIMKKFYLVGLVLMTMSAALILGSCGKSDKHETSKVQSDQPTASKTAYVVNYPLQYFAERIANGNVKVVFPAPLDEDPAFWMPDSNVIEQYQKSEIILLNGATYAKWIDKVSLPMSKMINTSGSFEDEYLTIKAAVKHSHGPSGEHSHEGTDFNTWMNPLLAVKQAEEISNAFINILPDKENEFKSNFELLKSDLLRLDSAFQAVAEQIGDTPLLASHPVYGYFAKRYGLSINSRVWEPEVVPDSHQWEELDHLQKSYKSKWMIWEGDPSEDNLAELNKRGISSVVIYPCGNIPENGNYLEVMFQNAESLQAIIK